MLCVEHYTLIIIISKVKVKNDVYALYQLEIVIMMEECYRKINVRFTVVL